MSTILIHNRSLDHLVKKGPSLSRIIQLAVSLVFDLSLNKPYQKDINLLICMSGYVLPAQATEPILNHTLEHRRAVLACFIMSSV